MEKEIFRKLKKGDKVILDIDLDDVEKGTVCEMIKDKEGWEAFRCPSELSSKDYLEVYLDYDEVKEYKPEFKVGDLVRINSESVREDEVGVIHLINVGMPYPYNVKFNEEENLKLFSAKELINITPDYDPKDVAFSKPHKYWNILEECTELAKEREGEYASIEENYKNILGILNQISVKQFTNEDINKVMLAVKLGRMKFDGNKKDNYLDAINYLAIDLYQREVKNK